MLGAVHSAWEVHSAPVLPPHPAATSVIALQCALCDGPIMLDRQEVEVDHRQPYAAGGSSDEANAQLVHASCNRGKGARSDADFRRKLGL